MADDFQVFLRDLHAGFKAERDRPHKGLPKEFREQQRAIAAACVGAVQSVGRANWQVRYLHRVRASPNNVPRI